MGVINDKKICAFTCHSPAYTDSEVLATVIGRPSSGGLRVRSQAYVRKDLSVLLRADKVSDLTSEPLLNYVNSSYTSSPNTH